MKITSQILPSSQIRFEVEVPGEYSRNTYDRILKDMMRKVNVPGFRPGKAPKQLVINHIGIESVKTSIVESAVRDAFSQIIKQVEEDGKKLIGEPYFEPEVDDLISTIEVGNPFSIAITTDFDPEVTLGDYKSISIQAGKVEPDPNYVSKTLLAYQTKHATLVPVEDRPAQKDDLVTLESEVINLADNTIIESLSDSEAMLDLDEQLLEFELFNMILGMNIGETREKEITLPPEFPLEELGGTQIRVKHRLIDIKYRDLPPLDDDFARSISQKQTLEELQEFLQQMAVKEAEYNTDINIEEALLHALVEITTVDLPATLIAVETDKLLRRNIKVVSDKLGIEEEDVISSFTKEMIDQMAELVLEEGIQNAKRSLALAKLAKLENLTIPPDQYQARLAELKESLKGRNYDDEFLSRVVRESIAKDLALAWLKENATIELIPEANLETGGEEPPESPDLVHNTDS